MLTDDTVLDLLGSEDLITIGMRADAVRKMRHADGFVSYSTDPPIESVDAGEIALVEEGLVERLAKVQAERYRIVRVKLSAASSTAVEALKLLALTRIYLDDVAEIEIPGSELGLKFCQIALRFGVNDLGCIGGAVTEEQILTLIRDAGFVPKKRNGNYGAYALK